MIKTMFLLSLTLLAFKANAEFIELKCETVTENEVTLILPDASLPLILNRKITLKVQGSSCNETYAYDASCQDPNIGIISLESMEFNPMIYWASFKDNRIRALGSVSRNADYLGNGKYIHQESGSLWLTNYLFINSELQLDSTVQELVLNGDICIDNPEHAYVIGRGGHSCDPEHITATTKEPQCIIHNKLPKQERNMPKIYCQELIDYWQHTN